MFGAIALGISGGLLGAFFIIINNQVNIIRKKILKFKILKILESVLLVTITVTTMYACVAVKHDMYYSSNPGQVCQNYYNQTLPYRQYLCENDPKDPNS
jgi:hypothetical protein